MDVLKQKIPYEAIAEAMDELVVARDPRTVHYMADRHLGRPAQSIQVSGDAERPLHTLIGVAGRDLAPLGAPRLPPGEAERPAAPMGDAHCLDDLDA